ncbi:hypothetical protein K503DRAFT_463960 [Rhizopogon vinicolor AM-OR11-026]|uniref:Uncharacterized protein n=1 Tax=Rhizopogon vinicolor AM-OR11-026 TaxID=1314800 RepID=A0A1B7MNP0_9AGAM|nr:hypothetical protein K503DRAFT_463960 [Rhizopogon vinicolor AM-OR11-026]
MSVNTTNSSNDEHRPLPDCWKPPKNRALVVLFTILCLLSVARPTLDDHWRSKINEEEWEKHKKIVMERLNNTNITAGLVLTSSSIFLSTTPPLTSILPYTIHSCYILSLGSFAHALCSLLFGLATVNIYGAADRKRARDVLTATRFRLYCTLLLFSWPVISLAISIICLLLSLLIACYASGLWWLKILTTAEIVLFWAWLPPLFLWRAFLNAPQDTESGHQAP